MKLKNEIKYSKNTKKVIGNLFKYLRIHLDCLPLNSNIEGGIRYIFFLEPSVYIRIIHQEELSHSLQTM